MIRALPSRYFADLIGKRWEAGARGPEAFDCLGLAIEVTRRRGHHVPAYLSDDTTLHRELAADGCTLGQLERASQPTAGDVVLLRGFGAPAFHLGVMIDGFRMLHSSESIGAAVIETIGRSPWTRRVVGYYRAPKGGAA